MTGNRICETIGKLTGIKLAASTVQFGSSTSELLFHISNEHTVAKDIVWKNSSAPPKAARKAAKATGTGDRLQGSGNWQLATGNGDTAARTRIYLNKT